MSSLFPFQVGFSSFHGSHPEFFMHATPFLWGELDFLGGEASLLKAPQQDQERANSNPGFTWTSQTISFTNLRARVIHRTQGTYLFFCHKNRQDLSSWSQSPGRPYSYCLHTSWRRTPESLLPLGSHTGGQTGCLSAVWRSPDRQSAWGAQSPTTGLEHLVDGWTGARQRLWIILKQSES